MSVTTTCILAACVPMLLLSAAIDAFRGAHFEAAVFALLAVAFVVAIVFAEVS